MDLWRSFIQRIAGTVGIRDGYAFALGKIAAADLPTCNATRQFEERVIPGAAGVADRKVRCEKDAANAFAWNDVGFAANDTRYVNVAGDTMTGDLVVPDEVYGVGWDASLEVPTKNAVYDKIQAVIAGATAGGSDTQVQFNDGGSFGGDSALIWNKTSNFLGINTTPAYTVDVDLTESAANPATDTAGYAARFDLGSPDPNAVHGGIWPEEARMGLTVARRFASGGGANGPTVALTSHIEANMTVSTGAAHVATAYGMVASSAVFAENLIALGADAASVKLVGCEIDVLPFAGRQPDAASGGLFLNAFNVAMDNAPAIMINGFTTGRWKYGVLVNGIHTDGVAFGIQAGAPEMEWGLHLTNGTYGTSAAQMGAQNDKPALVLLRGVAGATSNIFEIFDEVGTKRFVAVSGLGIMTVRTASDGYIAERFGADALGSNVTFRKSRNATFGSHTIVQSGDDLGAVIFQGSNGTGYDVAGYIVGEVDGTPGASGDMPGRISIFVTPDGSATPAEALKISNDKTITAANLAGTGTRSLGASATGVLTASSLTATVVKSASGVLSAATAGTDYYNPGGTDVAVADGGTGASTAAGAIANLGLDADIATLSLPASTTISATGASLIDDASTSAMLTTLGVDTDLQTFSVPASTTISAFGKTLVDDADEATARDTLGLIAGDAGDIWVEKAGDTMTGNLIVQKAAPTISLADNTGGNPQLSLYDTTDGGGTIYTIDGTTYLARVNTAGTFVANALSVAKTTGLMLINPDAGDQDTAIRGDTDTSLFYVDAGADSVAIGNSAPTSWLDLKAGTTARAPLRFPSGTNLTTPLAGAVEFDGTGYYETVNATEGRMRSGSTAVFYLTSNGSTISTIANFFGSTSAFATVTNGVYELTYHCFFLNSTAGTLVWTITNTQAWTNVVGSWEGSPVGGVTAVGGITGAGSAVATTTAGFALPTTGTLTDATRHYHRIRVFGECGTAGNIRLNATKAVGGTITPLRGSYYTVRRVSGNSGAFVA